MNVSASQSTSSGAGPTIEATAPGTLTACSGENWLFAYTADDERILEYRVGGGAFRTTLRDLNGKALREYFVEAGSNWSVFQDYIYRDTTLLASVHPTEGTRFFGPDHLGTPRAVFNSAGTLLALHTYYPFGEEATAATADTQQMKFTGHERDLLNTPTNIADDTDYMHARQFSIQTARFHSFDPVGGNLRRPQSWNRYAYVLGNPLKYTDPTGLETKGDPAVNPCDWPVQRECVDPDPGHWHMDPDAPRWGGGGGGRSGPSFTLGLLDRWLSIYDVDAIQTAGSYVVGFGDIVSMGLTEAVRDEQGLQNTIDESSTAYKLGEASGYAHAVATAGAGVIQLAGISTKVAVHGAHHSFGSAGRLAHVQINFWRSGVKGSNFVWRLPLPWR